ncbi:hypothetical protein GCM10027271_08300 [Saccharopolyspora gloriosae]|uniref:Glycopeptide antibiotics resistance protein n=1 Tax=Saccharopolyspora gloriosae TaxID=455344 RepID=A0A840NPU1_9PSEU|nr:VanZ family protein [Saccharopolyspora gloriosae]MBB5072378.1 glycopeptide antibiotics resistance protein [Saccharopolyspora gloriosae]
MIDRVTPAVTAIVFGVLLAVLLFVPFVAREYRWRGDIGVGRLVVVLGFVVHCWALMTYTLLPLPEVSPGFCATDEYAPQLVPLHFLDDVRAASWGAGALVRDQMVGQALLNVALFVPLGMFVRHLFRFGRFGTIAVGFGASLLIESTQLTGVWFLYPCAYRLFDVDDLLMNTAGAAFGLLLTPVLELVGGKPPERPLTPRRVTPGRRLLGMACDAAAVTLTGAALHGAAVAVLVLTTGASPSVALPEPARAVLNAWLPGALVLLVPTLIGSGGTLGQRAVLLRPALPDGALPGKARLLIRLLFGSGQYVLLIGFADLGPGELNRVAAGFIAGTAIAVWCTANHRGLSAWLTGLSIMDTRMPRSKFRHRKGDPFTPGETILVGSLPTFEPGGRDLRDLVDPRGVGAHRRPDS